MLAEDDMREESGSQVFAEVVRKAQEIIHTALMTPIVAAPPTVEEVQAHFDKYHAEQDFKVIRVNDDGTADVEVVIR